MRRSRKGPVSRLDAELRRLLKKVGRYQRRVHPEIWARWADIVGEGLARRALPCAYSRKILFISVATSAWLQQLTFLKAYLMERLHEEIGPDIVKEIKLNLDPRFVGDLQEESKDLKVPCSTDEPIDPELRAVICEIQDPELRETIENAVKTGLATDDQGSG